MSKGRIIFKNILFLSVFILMLTAVGQVFESSEQIDDSEEMTTEHPPAGRDDFFIRGDANADSVVDVSDVVFIGRYLYVPMSPPPPCMDAADADDNSDIVMSDFVYLLEFFLLGTDPPPLPYPDCGSDPTADGLDCDSHPCFTGGGPLYAGSMEAPDVIADTGESGYFQITGSCPDTVRGYQMYLYFDPGAFTVDSLSLDGCVGQDVYYSGTHIDSVQGWFSAMAFEISFELLPFTDEPLINVYYTASLYPSQSDLDLQNGTYAANPSLIPELTDGSFVTPMERTFIRGDANADSVVDISDVLFILHYVNTPGAAPPACMDAADVDDWEPVTMNDAVYLLYFLGDLGYPPPRPPYPLCGSDPTPDTLDCDLHPCFTGGGPLYGGSMEAPNIIVYPGDSGYFQITGSSPDTIYATQVYMNFDPGVLTVDSLTLDGCVGASGTFLTTIDNVHGRFTYINRDFSISPFTDQPLINVWYTASPHSCRCDMDLNQCAYTIFTNNSYYSLIPDLTDGTFHIPEETFFIFRTDSIPELPMDSVRLYGCEYVSAEHSVVDSILQVCDTIMVHWIRPAEIYCTWDTLHVTSVHIVNIDSIEGSDRQDTTFNRCQCLWVNGEPWHVWACGHISDIEEWWVILAKKEDTGNHFVRGDANGDGNIFMNDAIFILQFLYVPAAPEPPCLDAADVNDDYQGIRMNDAIYLLKHLYVPGNPQPPAPFPNCGPDSTNDCLGCASYSSCPQFIRGDLNGDEQVDQSDLDECRRGGRFSCDDAADINDDGVFNSDDCDHLEAFLFYGGWPPPPPFPACGYDLTVDILGCEDHPCQNVQKGAWSEAGFGGEIMMGEPGITDGRVFIPVYLRNTMPLSAFAYTIYYDPTVLDFSSVENNGLVTDNFDFFSSKVDERTSSVTVGNVVSFELRQSLKPGHHKVASLVFESSKLNRTTILGFTDVQLVDTKANLLDYGSQDCTITVLLKAPKIFAMRQAFPNPFTGSTMIKYQLPKESHVVLRIYNVSGQLIETLVNERQESGHYKAEWNGKDEVGMKVASGVYFYRLEVHTDLGIREFTSTKKMILLH